MLIRNLRYPLLYRAQGAWKPHSVDLPVNFSLQSKLWLVRSSRSASLASSPRPPPGHTQAGWGLVGQKKEGTAHLICQQFSLWPQLTHSLWTPPWMILQIYWFFLNLVSFGKKSMTTGVQKAEIYYYVKYFHFMLFWSFFLLSEEPLYPFWNILFIKM